MSEINTNTAVSSVDFDDIIQEFDKVEETESSPFSKQPVDAFEKIVDGVEKKVEDTENKDDKKEEVKTDLNFDKVLEKVETKEEPKEEIPTDSPLYSAFDELVKENKLFLFSDKENLKDYTKEELVELLKANDEHKLETALNQEIETYFESLPKDLQYALKYVSDGGKDLKSLYKALADTQDIKALDPSSAKDREEIVRQYYSSLDWSSEEIEDELKRLSDLGPEAYERQANKFKPKLEKMSEEIIQKNQAEQAQRAASQQKELQTYFDNAAETIKKGALGDIKLDKVTQASLYNGLTQPIYKTRKGAPTNELGHLLEKYQYVEPNLEKVYKALWLLKDEQGFLEKFGQIASNKQTSNTVRLLKTEQDKKTPTGTELKENEVKVKPKATIARPVNFMQGLNK